MIGSGRGLKAHERDADAEIVRQNRFIIGAPAILVGILIVISGLSLWKPVQFSEVAALFGNFQTIRLIHFMCMAAIVAFVAVHLTLALLVPQSLVAMITGGPVLDGKRASGQEAMPAVGPEAIQ